MSYDPPNYLEEISGDMPTYKQMDEVIELLKKILKRLDK